MLFAAALVGVLSYAIWVWARTEPEDPKARRVGPFLATPYLQLGEEPNAKGLTLLWHADDVDADWSVETRGDSDERWRTAGEPSYRRVILDGVERHRVYRATLPHLVAFLGSCYYRVKLGGSTVFEDHARGKATPGNSQRVVVFGDSSKNSVGQKKVAYQTHLLEPDMVLITGDLVYFQGRVGEYRPKFFPIYASPIASPSTGAPLLGSTLFVGVPGNHDLRVNDFDRASDLMAYFSSWTSLPPPRPSARSMPTAGSWTASPSPAEHRPAGTRLAPPREPALPLAQESGSEGCRPTTPPPQTLRKGRPPAGPRGRART
jgi:acid phosphatase type 7